jgi:hypothetical protein
MVAYPARLTLNRQGRDQAGNVRYRTYSAMHDQTTPPVPLQNSPQDCDLLFGRMGWLRQDRELCPFACST